MKASTFLKELGISLTSIQTKFVDFILEVRDTEVLSVAETNRQVNHQVQAGATLHSSVLTLNSNGMATSGSPTNSASASRLSRAFSGDTIDRAFAVDGTSRQRRSSRFRRLRVRPTPHQAITGASSQQSSTAPAARSTSCCRRRSEEDPD